MFVQIVKCIFQISKCIFINEEVLSVNIKEVGNQTRPQQRILPLFFTTQQNLKMLEYMVVMFQSQLVLTACFINVWYSTFYWPPYTVLRHGEPFNFYQHHYRAAAAADGRVLYCSTLVIKVELLIRSLECLPDVMAEVLERFST